MSPHNNISSQVEVVQVEDGAMNRLAAQNPDIVGMIERAKEATRKEHEMALMESLRLYPTAIAFSILLSSCIIMEGYDLNLMQGFFAFPPFQKKYGVKGPDGTYQITAAWQSGLTNGAAVGEILGLFINGIVSERFGYRKTVLGSLFAVTCFIFILFFAENVQTLEAGEILCGIPWGVFQTLTTVYASEVCPVALRAYLTTFVNLCWVIGTLLGQGVLRGFLNRQDQWAYRSKFIPSSEYLPWESAVLTPISNSPFRCAVVLAHSNRHRCHICS
jgi:MFS transporter, SP family, general alpha glucoside:H+ symporter